jgi:hypothetical protein
MDLGIEADNFPEALNCISSVERAERNISICNIERIAIALGVTMADLVSR